MTKLFTYCLEQGGDDPISQHTFLVLNLPGQPFTVYDEQKLLTIKKISDIYDRILLKTMSSCPTNTEVTFLAFGLGSLVASQLVIELGQSDHPIKNFLSFNGVFRVDDRIKMSFTDLSSSFQEANESIHLKVLDIVNNSKCSSIDWRSGCDELLSSNYMSDEFDRKSRLYCLTWIDSGTDLRHLWRYFEVLSFQSGAGSCLP